MHDELSGSFSPARYNGVVQRAHALAVAPNVSLDCLAVLRRSGYALPFLQFTVGPDRPKQMLISAGSHGDEPAGVYAALDCVARLSAGDCSVGALVFPCVNPTGFVAATRHNDIGYDLNRTFGQEPAPQETELVRQALGRRTFDCTLDLHEDSDADGFYVYEHVLSEDRALCRPIIKRVRDAGFPIHSSDNVEGYVMRDGCVVPKEEHTSELIGFFSVYLFDFYTQQSLTTETPSVLPMHARTAMHALALETLIQQPLLRV